jgi:hypothetical protein
MDPAALQAIIQAAVAAALLAALPQPSAPPQFAINPAGAGANPWDFMSGHGLKVYIAITDPFTPLYNGEQHLLNDLLRKIANRAESFSFFGILAILDDNGQVRQLTREHGCLTLINMQAAAIANLQAQGRNHQASEMLRKLLQASITSKTADRLFHRKSNYTVNIAAAALPGDPPNPPIMREDGPTMLFELIALVSVETRAMVATLGRKLDDMAAIMRTVKSNVQEFNAEVETIVDALNARNAPVPELRTKLFTGYKSCGDSAFIKYIIRKEEEYEDGSSNLTATQLMQVALEKFKTLTYKGEWMVKTKQELEFIALKAWQLKQINKKPNATIGPPGLSVMGPRRRQETSLPGR